MNLLRLTAFLLLSTTVLSAQINVEGSEIELLNEEGINTKEIEYSPVFYKGGVVFITSQNETGRYAITDINTGFNITSIYHATRDAEDRLQNPAVFAKELLSDRHEASLSFNSTSEVIYFTRNDEKEGTAGSGEYRKKLNIYSAQNTGEKWENITPMSFNIEGYNTIHPSISTDQDELYFASDRPGGYGSYDLYVVKKIGGEWSAPMNLGPQVNTPKDEVIPFIHADGTLYFTSNGHGGQGGTDIFYTQQSREVWKRPTNLGEPFNSSANDLAFIIDRDNRNGYISSDRSGGKGALDIYSFSLKEPEDKSSDEIMVSVLDARTNEPIEGAKITYVDMNEVVLPNKNGTETLRVERISGENNEFIFTLNAGEKAETKETDEEGKTFLGLESGQYALRASYEGYLPMQIQFSVPSTSNNTYIIPLDRAVDCVPISGNVTTANNFALQPGTEIVIKDINSGESRKAIVGEDGSYENCLKCGREYQIYAVSNGVSTEPLTVSTIDKPCNESLAINKELTFGTGGGVGSGNYDVASNGEAVAGAPVTVGSTIILPNIYFNFDDAGLRTDAHSDLDLVTKMLKIYPEMVIEIGSHTDARGPDPYNQNLSERRSQSVADYIIGQGIDASRVIPVGYGETRPRNRCVNGVKCPERLHRENRRTEVIVKEIGSSFAVEEKDPEALQRISEYASDATKSGEVEDSNNYDTPQPSLPTDADRPFYVIAGTYKSNENAYAQLVRIQDMGYNNAEVIQFDYPKLFAVCVEKYDLEGDATNLVNDLEDTHRVDAYVRRMD